MKTKSTTYTAAAHLPLSRPWCPLEIVRRCQPSVVSESLLYWLEERTGTQLVDVDGALVDMDDCSSCDSCGCLTLRQVLRSLRGRRGTTLYYCEDCISSDAFTCADCGDSFIVDLANGENTDGDTVCQSCGDEYFFCDSCSTVCHQNDYGGDGYCTSCHDENSLPDYHSQPRNYRPGKALLFGVELELLAHDVDDRDTLADLAKNRDWLAEQDGSLDDRKGIEIVAPPMTVAENLENWLPFLDQARRHSIGWDAGKGYGMHVSINRLALSSLHQGKLLVFVNSQKRLCEQIAGREENRWAMYGQKRLTDGRLPSGEKYEALALRSQGRMEMRIFRSTLSKEGFSRNVEFAAACVEFTRHAGLQELCENEFLVWMDAPAQRHAFPALHAHLFEYAERVARKAAFLKNQQTSEVK